MRMGGMDYRTTTAIAALAVVIGLAVPVVSAPGSTGAGVPSSASAGATIESSSSIDGAAGSADLQVVPTAEPAATPFVPVAPETPVASAQPQPERTGSGAVSSATTSVTAARPAAAAPDRPLAAQPAPITVATPTPTPSISSGCPSAISGSTPGAPSRASSLGVAGTTSADLQSFAVAYNAIRVANCLAPVPFSNIRYDSCMEDRLFWMAEDPSTDPMSAWGHIGSVRSDGVPSVGCDGNLAGGTDNSGATVAQKWWDSSGHRASLYKPTYTGATGNVCVLFAMTHGGVPNEPYSFTRAAARWVSC
ncbi:hypothetical protein [Microcella sp.]|uniref:hypothetical protein n=1 Tax=Microcella sp. TaxID=1913979 RepID=UPI003F71089F